MTRKVLLRWLLAGVLLMLLIPPWRTEQPATFHGYELLWNSPGNDSWVNSRRVPDGLSIDWPRMGFQALALGAVAGLGLAFTRGGAAC